MDKIYIGYDEREVKAFKVAWDSILDHAKKPVVIEALETKKLMSRGLLWRLVDKREGMYDLISNAPCSTDFAVSRFLPPILTQSGFVLCLDCDTVSLADIGGVFRLADRSKAVQVVKHNYVPENDVKMDGMVQTKYNRKNWSSVVLWNCDHPANRRLTLQDVNTRRGIELHQFYWLNDSEIGELPAEWNWLVGVQPKPEKPKIAHFTNGGPFLEGWPKTTHDEIWWEAYERTFRLPVPD